MAALCFGAGLALIAQPWWSERQQEKEQAKLLAEWDKRHAMESNNDIAVLLPPARSRAIPTSLSASAPEPSVGSTPSPQPNPPPGQAQAPQPTPNLPPSSQQASNPGPEAIDGQVVQGTIEIDSIGLREPILEGATDESLKYGIGTVVSGRRPGETGNYVLAGHNSRMPGKHFNRIHELKTGDKIVIATEHAVYVYAVASQSIVEPTDLAVLDQTRSSAELTLITCDRIVNPKHRLIVKAVLDSWKPA